MIPHISKNGTSFRGAGRYYLHDKDDAAPKHLKPRTDERVAWTATRNCVHDDPELALDEMWATAERQDALKRAAGVKLSGRRMECPVKTLSLAWHPSEQLTPQEIERAADSYVAHMGWSEHQALYVGHNDTPHAHVHIILNRVHPENGRTIGDQHDWRRSQAWALQHEKERGHIWCERRLEAGNDNARQPNLHVPHHVIGMTRANEQLFASEEERRAEETRLEWAMLKEQQKQERLDFFQDGKALFRELRHAVYAEVRAEYKDAWRDFHTDRKEREAQAERHSSSAITRAMFLLRQGNLDRAGEAFNNRDAVRDLVRDELEEKRAALHAAQRAETRERQDAACDALRGERSQQYEDLKQRHREEKQELREQQADGQPASWLWQRESSAADVALTGPTPAHQSQPEIVLHSHSSLANPPHMGAWQHDAGEAPAQPTGTHDAKEGVRVPTDLVAGVIGSLASYAADELGEFFAPTPPEVRDARAKAETAREQERPVVETKDQSPFARHVEAAVRRIEAEQEKKRDQDWDHHRDKERDR